MRLNGIQAEPGTVIGLHAREKKLLIVTEVDQSGVELRFNVGDEQLSKREPRSVAEHDMIPKKLTPCGLVRQYKPTPMSPVKIEMAMPKLGNRAMRRAFARNQSQMIDFKLRDK